MSDPSPTNPPVKSFVMQAVDTDQLTRPRGRPRTKVQPSEVYTSTPKQNQPPTQQEKKQEKKNKKAQVEEVTRKILEDFNDAIIEGISTIGVPAEFLYKSGRSPVRIVNTQYTDLANMLCINPMQANWMAHAYIELAEVPAIKKLIGEGGEKEGPSYIWMGLGLLGLGSYVVQMTKAIKALTDIKAKFDAITAMQEEADKARQNPTENVVRNFSEE